MTNKQEYPGDDYMKNLIREGRNEEFMHHHDKFSREPLDVENANIHNGPDSDLSLCYPEK